MSNRWSLENSLKGSQLPRVRQRVGKRVGENARLQDQRDLCARTPESKSKPCFRGSTVALKGEERKEE